MTKYLDDKGLKTFTTKMKGYADGKVGAVNSKVTSHINDKSSNPHGVTKIQVGLDKVDNVKQIPWSQRGYANGVATLDANGKVPTTQIPETKTINGQPIFGSGNITVSTSLYKIVDALPTKDIDITKIYLVPATATTAKNNKTEYIYLGDPNKAYDETKWEKFGEEQKNTNVDTSEGTIVIDMVLDKTSTHPIANKPVAEKFDEVVNTLNGKVAQGDYDTAMTDVNSKLKKLEDKTITTDSELSESSEHPIQTQAVYKAVQGLETKINNKADTTALTGAVTRITALEESGATDVTESGEGNGIASIKKVGKNIVATKGTFLTQHQSLTGYATQGWVIEQKFAKTSAIPSLDGYVNDVQTTGDASGNGVANITKNDKTITVTKGTFLTQHQSLAGYVNVVQKSGTGNGIADITKNGQTITVTKGTFLTQHQSLAEYVKTVNVQEVTNGNGIASIVKNGNALNVTQGAFVTTESLKGYFNTLYKEELEGDNGIAEVWVDNTNKSELCVKKTKFVTPKTLGDSIKEYASQQGYLTKEDMKETVVIKLVSDKSASDTNLNGVTVVVKSGDKTIGTYTWQGDSITVKIQAFQDITIEASKKNMYMKPKALKFTTSPLNERSVVLEYKALETGVFIIDKNDKFYKTSDEFKNTGTSTNDVIGALIVTDKVAIIVANYVSDSVEWGSAVGVLVNGCTISANTDSALKDFSGSVNTAAIIKAGCPSNTAASICYNYTFKNGKRGYLMSAGEASAIQTVSSSIWQLFKAIGLDYSFINSGEHWTSTQVSERQAWSLDIGSTHSYLSIKTRDNMLSAIPICSLYD